jgi:hypothetical protein
MDTTSVQNYINIQNPVKIRNLNYLGSVTKNMQQQRNVMRETCQDPEVAARWTSRFGQDRPISLLSPPPPTTSLKSNVNTECSPEGCPNNLHAHKLLS